MRALIDLIIKSKHWFVFLLLEAISLLFLFNHTGYPKSVYFTTANDVVGATYNVISSITSYLHLQQENQSLEQANEQLRRQLHEMEHQMAEMRLDSLCKNPWTDSSYDLINAQVVNATLHKSNNLLTINKGEADGVKPEMGVVCSQGVVGIVYMTSQHYSIVMPILNVNSKISCRLRHSEHFGSLIWERGQDNIAYVTNIPRHAEVTLKDTVETNGYSDIFPSGIPIGKVQRISDSPDGISYLIRITLFTDFATLRNVSVITNYQSEERQQLEQQAQQEKQ